MSTDRVDEVLRTANHGAAIRSTASLAALATRSGALRIRSWPKEPAEPRTPTHLDRQEQP